MIKKALIIGGVGALAALGAVIVGLMIYTPKEAQAYVPVLKIEPAKEKNQHKSKSRYQILKDAKFNKAKPVEKQVAPIFEIDPILTEEADASKPAQLDTVALIESMLKKKRGQENKLKSAKASSRVGGEAKKIYAPRKVRTQKAIQKTTVKPPLPQAAAHSQVTQVMPASHHTAVEKVDKESNKEKKTYSFNYISKEVEQVRQGDFVRAELTQKLKVRSGSNGIELKLLEGCTVGDRQYIQGDIMHGFSRLSGDRMHINISSITSNETGETDFVSLRVFDNDFQEGLAYDARANNEKKRIISRTSRDLIPDRIPGANTARGIVNTIAGTANGKFAKGYQVRVATGNNQNNYANYQNK